MIHRVIACAAALSLSACMVVSIDETTVFEPIAYDEALAKLWWWPEQSAEFIAKRAEYASKFKAA